MRKLPVRVATFAALTIVGALNCSAVIAGTAGIAAPLPTLLPANGPAFVDRPTHVTSSDRFLYVSEQATDAIRECEVDLIGGGCPRTIGIAGGGTGGGQFQSPQQTVVVGTDLFVADQGNNRIQRLSLVNGAYQSEFGTGGAGLGQLSAPTGLAYNPGNGRLYVSELGNDRIQMFGLDGTPLATFGSPGSGDGQLDDPTALALDSFGNLYVADTNNNRIVAFSADGVFLRVVRSGVASPKGVAVDESDLIWTVSPTTSQLLAINRAGDTVVAYAASRHPGNHANNLREARGIAILNPRSPGYIKGRPLVMVADNDQSFIVGFQIGNAAREYRLIKTFQTTLTSAGQIALDRFDNLYVTSPLQARVHKYDSNGALIASWGSQGSAPGQFNTPYGIAVTTDDRVFVSDTLNHRVQQFDSVGTYQNQFGVQGAGIGELNMPMMLTARFGTFVVADSGNGRIVSWTPGSFFQPIGSQGSGDGELSQPAASGLDLRVGR